MWGYRALHMFASSCARKGEDVGSQVDMHTCSGSCTHYNEGGGPKQGLLGHTHREGHIFMQLCKGVEETWEVRWTCKHVLIHVHIPTKVWDQMRDFLDMHSGPHKGTSFCTNTPRGGADMGTQVDMHICTDACTNSNQVVGPDIG